MNPSSSLMTDAKCQDPPTARRLPALGLAPVLAEAAEAGVVGGSSTWPAFSAPMGWAMGGRVWAMPLWQSMQVWPAVKATWWRVDARRFCSA
jgi:hypothetical protein